MRWLVFVGAALITGPAGLIIWVLIIEHQRRIHGVAGSKRWCLTCRTWVALGCDNDDSRRDAWQRHEHDHKVGDKLMASIMDHPELAELEDELEHWYGEQLS